MMSTDRCLAPQLPHTKRMYSTVGVRFFLYTYINVANDWKSYKLCFVIIIRTRDFGLSIENVGPWSFVS